MAIKYYGVKKGRTIGVFYNWEECKSMVHGFKGAEYKSFKTENEAKVYVFGENISKKKLTIENTGNSVGAKSNNKKSKKKKKKKKKRNVPEIHHTSMEKNSELNKNVDTKKVAEYLIKEFKSLGFIVHYYYAIPTRSVYIKLDYGTANSIRISDHDGYEYSYRYNLRLDIKTLHREVSKDGYEMFYIPLSMWKNLIKKIQLDKNEKINKYGMQNYNKYMALNRNEAALRTKGFWTKCTQA